jgi:thiamine pyrophosphokinase
VVLPEGTFVIAADVGLAEAMRLGVPVDVLVGDLDSVSGEMLEAYLRRGGRVRRHPRDKDATDLDLSLDEAITWGADHIVVVGGQGGRFDHLLGNALSLASPRRRAVEIDAVFGAARLHVVWRRRGLTGEPGELVSLFALGGAARGVRTTGLRWRLDDADLAAGSSLGISNRFLGERAAVEVREGAVLVVRPGEGATA